jgi:glycosyltransferase involved in cell wall biosynthesis
MLGLPGEERKKMGARGSEFIRSKYTWDIAARKMITVYHAVLNKQEIPLYPEPFSF